MAQNEEDEEITRVGKLKLKLCIYIYKVIGFGAWSLRWSDSESQEVNSALNETEQGLD